jgi:hypothetical protein
MPRTQAELLPEYRATTLLVEHDGAWIPFRPAPGTWLVITAANPWSLPVSAAINRARDGVLAAELSAQGLQAQRVRGQGADPDWHEDGWAIAHALPRSLNLLRRYHQAAGFVLSSEPRQILWADGHTTPG